MGSFFLVLVESPSKCQKIQKILNSHYKNKKFIVKATVGHIRDLKKKELGIDVKNNFEGNFQLIPKRNNLIGQLRKLIKDAELVYLAMDNDREGMRIAYDVQDVFKIKNSKRIIFTEITQNAIIHAVENPVEIDMNIVYAQMCRRYLDRLIGFSLSPVVRKNVSALSAGRCQSVIAKMIIERDTEINNSEEKHQYEINGNFSNNLNGKCNQQFQEKNECIQFLEKCKNYNFYVKSCKVDIKEKHPPPPFITSTVQQECIKKFKYSSKSISSTLQTLYQKGLITYIRTDSTNISNMFLNVLKNYVNEKYGENNYHRRTYTSKVKGAQLAHECIRVTNLTYDSSKLENIFEKNIYNVILKRTLATQIKPKKFKEQVVLIGVKEDESIEFKCTNEEIIEKGWTILYENKTLKINKLKNYEENSNVTYKKINANYIEKTTLQRYNEAMIIKDLEKKGIGRPSTYANLIDTVQKRGYVIKNSEKGQKKSIENFILKNNEIEIKKEDKVFGKFNKRFVPTILGKNIVKFLNEDIEFLMDYNYTSSVEDELDEISHGNLKWKDVLKNHYNKLNTKINNINKDIKVKQKMLKKILKYKGVSYELRKNNYGYVLSSDSDRIYITDEIDENNVKSFKKYFPRYFTYNDIQGKIILGKFGYYMIYDNKNYNVKYYCENNKKEAYELKNEDYQKIIEKENNKQKELGKVGGEPLYLCNGKFGLYIKYKNKNKSMKKIIGELNRDIDDLTHEDLVEIVSNF